MKDYQDVVMDRYEGREERLHPYANQYYFLNHIGFQAAATLSRMLYEVFNVIRGEGPDVTELRILDIGCGKGHMTRQMLEISLSPSHVSGMDLSPGRVAKARTLNPGISYTCADILTLDATAGRFDVVTAFDVFMHLGTDAQISSALHGVFSVLSEGGYFVWYDVVARDHFSAPVGAEANGFSRRQMNDYCCQAGFRKVREFRAFKNILWRYHSLYLRGKLPEWCVQGIERIFPGSPGNVCMLFRRDG